MLELQKYIESNKFTTNTTRKVSRVANCLQNLYRNVKNKNIINQSLQNDSQENSLFDDQTINKEYHIKLIPPKSAPSNNLHENDIKNPLQKPSIRLISKSKQKIQINQVFNPNSSFYSKKQSNNYFNQQSQSSLNHSKMDYDKNTSNEQRDSSRQNKNETPRHQKNRIYTENSSDFQNQKDGNENVQWNYSVKTDQDNNIINILREVSSDKNMVLKLNSSASRISHHQNKRYLHNDERIMQTDDSKNSLIQQINAQMHDKIFNEDKSFWIGRQIKTQQKANTIPVNQTSYSGLLSNNFSIKEYNSQKGLSSNLGEYSEDQYDIRTRSCQTKSRKSINRSLNQNDSKRVLQKILSATHDFNQQQQIQSYQDEDDQKCSQDEFIKKSLQDNILRQIIQQVNQSEEKNGGNQQEQNEKHYNSTPIYFEHKDRFLNNDDRQFFKQVKQSQKLLLKLQKRSFDSINQIQQIQNIEIKGQSFRNRFGLVNIEKIIKTLKFQRERQKNQSLCLKGSQFVSQKSEENLQNAEQIYQNDRNNMNLSPNQILHINGLNKNPKVLVKECEVQKYFQQQIINQKCCKGKQDNQEQQIEHKLSPPRNQSCQEESLNFEQSKRRENSNQSTYQSRRKQLQNSQQNIIQGIKLTSNTNHINFRKYNKRDHQLKQNEQDYNVTQIQQEKPLKDDNKIPQAWEQNSFSQTGESLFLEFVQRNLNKRKNMIHTMKQKF